MTKTYEEIVALVRDTLVDAGSTFREDKKEAYKRAINTERNEQAKMLFCSLPVVMQRAPRYLLLSEAFCHPKTSDSSNV